MAFITRFELALNEKDIPTRDEIQRELNVHSRVNAAKRIQMRNRSRSISHDRTAKQPMLPTISASKSAMSLQQTPASVKSGSNGKVLSTVTLGAPLDKYEYIKQQKRKDYRIKKTIFKQQQKVIEDEKRQTIEAEVMEKDPSQVIKLVQARYHHPTYKYPQQLMTPQPQARFVD